MKKFRVYVEEFERYWLDVEAESEEDARKVVLGGDTEAENKRHGEFWDNVYNNNLN